MNSDYINLLVEVAVTVYVFLLGLPVLVSQIFMPEDLRRMSNRNYLGHIPLALTVLTLLLILILLIDAPFLEPSLQIFFPHAKWEMIASVLFWLMLLFSLVFLLRYMLLSRGYRARIINIIQRKLMKGYRKTGDFDQDLMDDLTQLGISSKAGSETRLVINALQELITVVCRSEKPLQLDANLLQLIECLAATVTNAIEPGNQANMKAVAEIYQSLFGELQKRSADHTQVILGNEVRRIRDSLSQIAQESLKLDYIGIMPLVINALTLIPGASPKLFEIGIAALKEGEYATAISALSEMKDRDNKDPQTQENYLGLIAHFLAAGPTAKTFAESSLKRTGIPLNEKNLESAKQYHYALSHFDTVDGLWAIGNGL